MPTAAMAASNAQEDSLASKIKLLMRYLSLCKKIELGGRKIMRLSNGLGI